MASQDKRNNASLASEIPQEGTHPHAVASATQQNQSNASAQPVTEGSTRAAPTTHPLNVKGEFVPDPLRQVPLEPAFKAQATDEERRGAAEEDVGATKGEFKDLRPVARGESYLSEQEREIIPMTFASSGVTEKEERGAKDQGEELDPIAAANAAAFKEAPITQDQKETPKQQPTQEAPKQQPTQEAPKQQPTQEAPKTEEVAKAQQGQERNAQAAPKDMAPEEEATKGSTDKEANQAPKEGETNKQTETKGEEKTEGQEKSEEGREEGEAHKEPSLLEKARAGLHQTFDNAVHFIQHGSRLDIPHDQQIHMTALLKQATRGDCSSEEEPKEDDAKEGWKEWCALKGMSRTEAMKEYTKLLTTWKSDWQTPEGENSKAENPSLIEQANDKLRATFDKAAHFVQHGTKLDMPEDQQKRMGALLKQATFGDCNKEDPKLKEEDPTAVTEWCNLKGISRIDAMKEYVKMLTSAKSDWEQGCENCPKGGNTKDQQGKTSDAAGKGGVKESEGLEQKRLGENKATEQQDKAGAAQPKEGAENRDEEKAEAHEDTLLQKTFDTVKSTYDKCAHYVQRGLNLAMPQFDGSKADALFKQATMGDITEAEPEEEKAKQQWNSWNSLKGLDKKEAMKQYIKLLTSSKSEWEECERFAKDTEKVASLMKDLDIQEEACAACEPEASKKTLGSDAYIREKQSDAPQMEQGLGERA